MKSDAKITDLVAAATHVESMVPRADVSDPYPLWHGWALRGAYLAGLTAGREQAAVVAEAGNQMARVLSSWIERYGLVGGPSVDAIRAWRQAIDTTPPAAPAGSPR